MTQNEAGSVAGFGDPKHLLDLFELLYHWHDGPAGQRSVKRDVEEEFTAGCSTAVIGAYDQLRTEYLRGRQARRPGLFGNYASTLALSCVIELDPENVEQREAIGELVRPNFAQAPVDALGRRWLEDATATAWRIAVADSAEQQRGK